MAGVELGARWTDEKYATKSDLVANLHTSLIDQLWERVESYRKVNQKILSLRTLTQHSYKITLTPIINHRINEFEKKLDAIRREYEALGDVTKVKARVSGFSKLEMLRAIAEIEDVRAGELSLKAMLNGTYRESDLTHQPVLGYRDALSYLERNFTQPITEDLLAELYGLLLSQRELTSFYRLENNHSVYNTIQVNRDYFYAPAESLPMQMDALFSFLANDPCDFFIKAMTAYYEIVYLKPFDRHNEAIAAMLAKFVLAQSGLGESAVLIPVETLARPSRKRFKELFLETQRQADITYIVLFAIEVLNPLLDQIKAEIRGAEADVMRQEMARPDVQEQAEKPNPAPVPAEPQEVAAPPSQSALREVPVAAPTPIAPAQEPKEEVRPAPAVEKAAIVQLPVGERALRIPEPKMSDKEVKEYARYIVETNPNVRKPQALFFASHCTLGRFYTIQDYKKATRCAYETARTSMDNLAAQGFYKKMQLKNKFVYTPIAQGDIQ